jgi:hypothetical protein
MVDLVLSRLDYGNGVLVGLPNHLVRRLQSVQNAAARLICNLRHSDFVIDALISLHWLRIPERIVCTIVLTFKVLHGSAPEMYVLPISLVDKASAQLVPAVWYQSDTSRLAGTSRAEGLSTRENEFKGGLPGSFGTCTFI